jgi:hypothetical protein
MDAGRTAIAGFDADYSFRSLDMLPLSGDRGQLSIDVAHGAEFIQGAVLDCNTALVEACAFKKARPSWFAPTSLGRSMRSRLEAIFPPAKSSKTAP